MRLSVVSQGARPVLSDRNGIGRVQSFQTQGVAPHSSTVRWTYTVPAGKKSDYGLVTAQATRQTVATTPDKVDISHNYQPVAQGNTTFMVTEILANTVGEKAINTGSPSIRLLTGDIVSVSTQDLSTGGTTNIYTGALLTEGDA